MSKIKKYTSFLTITLLISFLSFCQTDLYVSNNANISIFVDGDGFADQSTNANSAALFVTNRINLAGLNARIYLRDGAQLLQDGTIQNRGRGQLSVYQTGTANNYTYNYWGVPVGNTAANNNNNRPFIPDAGSTNGLFGNIYDVTGLTTSDPALYTTSLDGSTAPLTISNDWLYTFSPGEVYADWDYIGETGSVTPGYGFVMKGTAGSGSSQLYDFRGKPNTGNMNVAVIAPVAGNPQFTLAGNPYPSSIDMVDFFHDTGANNGAFMTQLLFWEQLSSGSHNLNSYVGGYAIYTINTSGVVSYTPAPWNTYDSSGNIVGGLGTSPNNNPGVNAPGRYLPVGQGFMIEGTNTGNIEFRNSFRRFWKESSGNIHFFEPNNETIATRNSDTDFDGNAIPDDWMRIRILVDIVDSAGLYTRELLVNFTNEATDAFDYGIEAKNSDLKPSDGHFVTEGEPMAIYAVPFEIDRKLPLTVTTAQTQHIGIRTYGLQNFPEDVPIYVHDKMQNTYTNLKAQTFSTPLEAGTHADRFEIVFEMEDTLSEEEIISADFTIFQNNNTSKLTVLNPNSENVTHISLFDTAGKRILDQSLDIQTAYYFSTKNMSDGVYIAKVLVNNTTPITKKVIIKQ